MSMLPNLRNIRNINALRCLICQGNGKPYVIQASILYIYIYIFQYGQALQLIVNIKH